MDATGAPAWGDWQWRPDRTSWFEGVRAGAPAWVPPPELGLDAAALRVALASAARDRAAWLVHPCVGVLFAHGCAPEAHARLAGWIAVNTPLAQRDDLGALSLQRETCLWLGDGPCVLEAGTHPLASLAATPPDVSGPALPDPWGDSLPAISLAGDIGDASWWARQDLSEAALAELTSDVRSLLLLQALLADTLPQAAAWVRTVTRVIVPLVRSDADEFRSGSVAGVPGLVFVEMTQRQLLILEALVHESAHLHFHLAESGRGFIPPGHAQLYASPLRRDPRPLRGIFLAYHALLYMCAFYRDWEARTGDARAREARAQLTGQRDAAAQVLQDARAHLSPAGNAFLAHCLALAEADDRR